MPPPPRLAPWVFFWLTSLPSIPCKGNKLQQQRARFGRSNHVHRAKGKTREMRYFIWLLTMDLTASEEAFYIVHLQRI